MVLEIPLGAVVQLRKVHPCGGDTWVVVRLGADIGLHCTTCQHFVMLERRVLERRIKRFLDKVESPPSAKGGQQGDARPGRASSS